MDEVLLLARAQFGLNIGFHILFPTLTIALGWILLYFRIRYARSGDPAWLATYKLWTKVFALSFAMGVVSGITMSFQFGTNWPGFMQKVGNIAGPLLAYEVLTAFFLEATFLGVMLFGMNRVPDWLHITSTVLVAAGTTLSAFWILALNSWMQTPAGHEVVGGQVIAASWLKVIFNPSFPYRLVHMLLASGLTASFVTATGMSAFHAAPYGIHSVVAGFVGHRVPGLDDLDVLRRQAVAVPGDGNALHVGRKMSFNGQGHRSGGLAGGSDEDLPFRLLRQVARQHGKRVGGRYRRAEALFEKLAHRPAQVPGVKVSLAASLPSW